MQKLIACLRQDKCQSFKLRIPSFLLDYLMQVFCDKEPIIHHLCRIFEHDMVHLLKDIMLSAADNLICVVHGSRTPRFHLRELSFNLNFRDNFFQL